MDPDAPPDAPRFCFATAGALDLLPWPVWVLDPLREQNVYANPAGLALWGVESVAALLRSDHAGMSATARARVAAIGARTAAGEVVVERWTFYPRDEARTLDLAMRAVTLDDGRPAVLVQANPCEPDRTDRRAAEALHHAAVAATIYDEAGTPLFRNPAALAAYPAAGHRFADRFIEPGEAEALWRQLLDGADVGRVVRVATAAGERWHGLDARQTRDPVTGHRCVLVHERDVSGLKAAEACLLERERQLVEVQEIARLSDWRYEVASGRFSLPPRLAALLGLADPAPSFQALVACFHPADREAAAVAFGRALALGGGGEMTCRVLTAGREACSLWLRWDARTDAAGRIRAVAGVARDVTEEVRARERIEYLALHDGITGLVNRSRFTEELARRLQQGPGCLMLVDLDGFKEINDTHGHVAGDQVLVEMSRRLRAALRPADLVARVGADEFGLLLTGPVDPAVLERRARELLDQLCVPLLAGGTVLTVGVSIGISVWPADGGPPATMLRNADLALKVVKTQGGNGFAQFDESLRQAFDERRWIAEELPAAIADGQLEVHYQPLLSLADERPVGFEALVRWRHPTRGLVPPARFIGVAEEGGLIWSLGAQVLTHAVRQMRRWLEAGLEPGWVAVNIGGGQLRNPQLPRLVMEVLAREGLEPARLELEVTEDVTLGRGAEHVQRVVEQLAAAGVRIVLDDFGTGHASLTHLKRLPISRLKIDRSFVANLESDPVDGAIVRSVVELGRSLQLSVVAEGVDRERQAELLREWGCDLVQGFLYQPALPAEAATRWLAAQRRGAPPRAQPRNRLRAAVREEAANVKLLRGAYRRWAESRGTDVDCWLELVGEETQLRSLADGAADLAFTAARQGRVAIRAYFTGLLQDWEMLDFEIDEYIAEGARVVAIGRCTWRNRRTGRTAELPKIDLWRFRDGRAVEMVEFYDTARAHAAALP